MEIAIGTDEGVMSHLLCKVFVVMRTVGAYYVLITCVLQATTNCESIVQGFLYFLLVSCVWFHLNGGCGKKIVFSLFGTQGLPLDYVRANTQ